MLTGILYFALKNERIYKELWVEEGEKTTNSLLLWSYLELSGVYLNKEFRRNLFYESLYWKKGSEIFHQEITFGGKFSEKQ